MKIKDWLAERGASQAWLARQVSISPARLNSYLGGGTKPPVWFVQAIHRLTGGAVSLFDWTCPRPCPRPASKASEPGRYQRLHACVDGTSNEQPDPPPSA